MKISVFVFFILFASCTDKVIEGSKLPKSTVKFIQSLGVLESNEQILFFYTSLTNETSGNFITAQRVASYWQNKTSPQKNFIKSAFYSEIDSIGIKYGDGFEFTSAFVITKKDGEKFEVYFNHTKENMDKLHEKVKELWEQSKK